MFMPPSTVAASTDATCSVSVPMAIRSCTWNGSLANLRMVRIEPSSDSGGTMTLTREPSARRASTIGEASSMRRPTDETMRSIDTAQVLLGDEAGVGLLDDAVALDVDVVAPVDHDLGDGRVVEELLDRAEAHHVAGDVLHQTLALLR